MAIASGKPGWQRRARWLNLAGILDFAVALFTGVITSNNVLGVAAHATESHASLGLLPLVLVPAFGVPLFMSFHVISLLQLRHRQTG